MNGFGKRNPGEGGIYSYYEDKFTELTEHGYAELRGKGRGAHYRPLKKGGLRRSGEKDVLNAIFRCAHWRGIEKGTAI